MSFLWFIIYYVIVFSLPLLLCDRANLFLPTSLDESYDYYVSSADGKYALLDCGSPRTIAGQQTLEKMFGKRNFIDRNTFPVRFGDGTIKHSIGNVAIPLFKDAKNMLKVAVIPGSLPILFSLKSLESTKAMINFDSKRAIICGRRCTLVSNGKHIFLDLETGGAKESVITPEEDHDYWYTSVPDEVYIGDCDPKSFYLANVENLAKARVQDIEDAIFHIQAEFGDETEENELKIYNIEEFDEKILADIHKKIRSLFQNAAQN